MQFEVLEQLLHGDFLALKIVHDAVAVVTVRLLDEAQEMLLVHAGSCVDVRVNLMREWVRRVFI